MSAARSAPGPQRGGGAEGAAPARGPGRPRSAASHAAILRAALELAIEDGLAGMTIEAVAARAGVGKTTIYRRWSSKHELVAAAVRFIAHDLQTPDLGSVRDDYLALAGAALASLAPGALKLMPRLMLEAADDPELFAVCREVLIDPRRAALGAIVARGIERGEVRGDVDIDVAVDVLIAPMIYRALISGADPAALQGLPEAVFELVSRGLTQPAG
jgi:AcrR family transcriptional regulator